MSDNTDKNEIVYRVNDQDDIVFVNEQWDKFAAANNGDSVSSHKILNRPLWEFIADPTTRELYRQILKQIREGSCIRFSLRCDSPDCQRLLEMDVRRRDDGTVEFSTQTVSENSREPIDISNAVTPVTGEFLTVCGWCKKICLNGEWVEIEEAVAKLSLFGRRIPPSLTHGICDSCMNKMRQTLERKPTSQP